MHPEETKDESTTPSLLLLKPEEEENGLSLNLFRGIWNWLKKKLRIKHRGRRALDDLLQRSMLGHSHRVRAVSGTRVDAEAEFRRIAQTETIVAHPNSQLAAAGGLQGRISGGGRIYFRSYSTSGPPTHRPS